MSNDYIESHVFIIIHQERFFLNSYPLQANCVVNLTLLVSMISLSANHTYFVILREITFFKVQVFPREKKTIYCHFRLKNVCI